MSLIIRVAHDFICPWCWVGLLQANRLKEEFPVDFEWLAYELFPEELEWSAWKPAIPEPPNKPHLLSRFDFILAADGVTIPPTNRPQKMRTFFAHAAVEYAKTEGVANELVERLYRAYWEEAKEINSVEVLLVEAKGIVRNLGAFERAVRERTFRENIVGFDEEAYAKGVYNVPTFYIGGERYAERPYVNLRDAVMSVLA